jgi:hypothetical protein
MMMTETPASDSIWSNNTVSPDLTIQIEWVSIRHYRILNEERTVLTKDTESNVAIYDVSLRLLLLFSFVSWQ